MLNRSASLAMSTSVLKASPGKLYIKRHSPTILFLKNGFTFRQKTPNSRELAQSFLTARHRYVGESIITNRHRYGNAIFKQIQNVFFLLLV